MRSLILLITLVSSIWAIDTGTLSFFLMKDGTPLKSQEVIVFKKSEMALIDMPSTYNHHAEFITDEDGYIHTVLPVGTYQLQLVAKVNNIPQAYVKKPFVIEKNKESQLIVSLKEDNTIAFEDSESPKAHDIVVDTNNTAKEKGFVLISLVSSEDDKPVKDARIFVQGESVDVKSDASGNVSLNLLEGEYTISIIHSNFSAQTLKLQVIANETVNKFYEMSPASMELEEFVVLAPQVEGSVAAAIAEERNSESIGNIVGAEQMARQGDSNAASALKRVAGITLIGGKDIYVRGLGDRYSATELNSMALPSPNPIKRTIPLDMFPSSIIGSLEVQKTASADITSGFGGGYVNVRTKKSTDDDYVKFKIGLNAHDSYGKNAVTSENGFNDWTGYDDTFRPFPDGFVNDSKPVVGEAKPELILSNQEIQQMLQQRDVNRQIQSVPLGTELGMEVGTSFDLGDEQELSILATYDYKSRAKLVEYISHDYLISSAGDIQGLDNTAANNLYRTTVQHGGILNASYRLHNFDVGYTLLYVLNTLDQTRDIEGSFGENNSEELQTYFEWQERELFVNQINGGVDYKLFVDNRFNFGAEYAKASEYVPNDVQYTYLRNQSNEPYQFKRRESQLVFDNRETKDDLSSFYVNNKSMIDLLSEEDYLEFGAMTELKERTYRRVQLQIKSLISNNDPITRTGNPNDIINEGDGSNLDPTLTSQPKDQYNADSKRTAFYFKSMLKPTETMDITFGVRQVDYEQVVDQFKVRSTIVVTEENTLAFKKTLPSISLKYGLTESQQLRFAYSETYVAPDIREFVNSEFIHPVYLAKVSGNPDLIETDIKSIDARYEYYLSSTDMFSFAMFYKDMTNPIEDTRKDTTGTIPRFSFQNAAAAQLAGLELSWYNHLGAISPWFEDLVFSGNYTHIRSSVELTQEQKQTLVTQERNLQGLSPNVINLALSYEDLGTRIVTLSYNKMDERLMRVAIKNGEVILGLDDYEIPPDVVDFTWIEKFNVSALNASMALTFKAKNLLNSETQWQQGGKTTLIYKTGRSYSLSLSSKF
ncbi:TonB-dependent receptor [Sulfurimonas sp. MAG313]|nr:TonB-dependent receptor [Sulfurimonas sp. MAG313]MDF1881445.1 TonB-dependent receptor [Sulfurimonas sp. MAG313]